MLPSHIKSWNWLLSENTKSIALTAAPVITWTFSSLKIFYQFTWIFPSQFQHTHWIRLLPKGRNWVFFLNCTFTSMHLNSGFFPLESVVTAAGMFAVVREATSCCHCFAVQIYSFTYKNENMNTWANNYLT